MKETSTPLLKEQEEDATIRQMGGGLTLSLNLVVSTLLGLGMGMLLDKWFGMMPLFTLVFMVLGFVAGMRKMLQVATREMQGDEK